MWDVIVAITIFVFQFLYQIFKFWKFWTTTVQLSSPMLCCESEIRMYLLQLAIILPIPLFWSQSYSFTYIFSDKLVTIYKLEMVLVDSNYCPGFICLSSYIYMEEKEDCVRQYSNFSHFSTFLHFYIFYIVYVFISPVLPRSE